MKKRATLWTTVQINFYGWAWVLSWFAAIWWEPYRWPLFWTGAFALLLGVMIDSGTKGKSE